MYYYIIEALPKYNLTRLQNKIRAELDGLGISGEMALASPARGAEELAQIGLEKGYSTIVAIGDDFLINRLAALLVNSSAALGIIPVGASYELSTMFGAPNLRVACQTLRNHQTRQIDLAQIAPNKYFLSNATITPPEPAFIELELDNKYRLEATIRAITISSKLNITLWSHGAKAPSIWGRMFKQASPTNLTILQAHNLRLYTPQPFNINIDNHVFAKTPAEITRHSQVLKVITTYDKLK